MSVHKFLRSEQVMSSTDLAETYARQLVMLESTGPGDLEPALSRLEAKTGIGYWTLWGLWNKRRKLVDRDLFNQLRGAYLALCERKVATLQHNLAVEKARSGDDAFEDISRKLDLLAEEVKAAKEGLKLRTEEPGK